ncbi:MBL fold metallo-hydrolase [Jiella endophytica]|nr:MBL fold metallo-hydrolase [Jiella endophytica]
MLNLGAATLEKIVDIDPFVLPADLLLPGCDLRELANHADLLAPDHVDFAAPAILLSLHSFVLRIAGRIVLIDSCVGEDKPRPRRADWHQRKGTGYLDRLGAAGLTPADVDIVLCTHLHADHVGWNTKREDGRWVPTFPNARYVIGRRELDHWEAAEREAPGSHNHGAFADSVLPVIEAGLVERVDDGVSLFSGAEIVPLAGHSPGQIGLDLRSRDGHHALFCGDAIHSPVQVFRPHWSSRFCFDKAAAGRLRQSLLERAAEDDTLLLPAHLRGACGMRIVPDRDGFRPLMV